MLQLVCTICNITIPVFILLLYQSKRLFAKSGAPYGSLEEDQCSVMSCVLDFDFTVLDRDRYADTPLFVVVVCAP